MGLVCPSFTDALLAFFLILLRICTIIPWSSNAAISRLIVRVSQNNKIDKISFVSMPPCANASLVKLTIFFLRNAILCRTDVSRIFSSSSFSYVVKITLTDLHSANGFVRGSDASGQVT